MRARSDDPSHHERTLYGIEIVLKFKVWQSGIDFSLISYARNYIHNEIRVNTRSGQVRVFNVHIQSKPVTGTGTRRKKKGGWGEGRKWESPALAGTREYEQSDRNR